MGTPRSPSPEKKARPVSLDAKVDKGKGREVEEPLASPEPLSPPPTPAKPIIPAAPVPVLLAGLAMMPDAVSALLTKAKAELPLRPIRIPIIGEYPDCFSGEEFAVWLKDNVPGLGGSLDTAEDAAIDLTERDNLLRRIGELGEYYVVRHTPSH